MKTIEGTTSNPDLISFSNMKIHRVDRGVYGASGNITINFDIVEGDDTEVNITAFSIRQMRRE